MGRLLFLILLLAGLAGPVTAEPRIVGWEVCEHGACRPLEGPIDPYGRLVEVRGRIEGGGAGPWALRIAGAASSEVWFNRVRVGANGRPAPTREGEVPGRYETAVLLPPHLWHDGRNTVVIRFSSHRMGLHFARPISDIRISRVRLTRPWGGFALTFAAIGALLAACAGFAALTVARPSRPIAFLCAIAATVALQGLAESLRWWFVYPYPFHAWRMAAIWACAAVFAVLVIAYAAERFWPERRRWILLIAVAGSAATGLIPSFDHKVAVAMEASVLLAIAIAVRGVKAGRPGARGVLAFLVVYMALLVASPAFFIDHGVFLLVAAMVLGLLVGEVVRMAHRDREREAELTRAATSPDRLGVATARGVEFVRLAEVVAILGADDYAELRLTGGRSLLHAARLDHLETSLPGNFARTHRSAIANLDHVTGLARNDQRWRLRTSENISLPVSRGRLATLKARLGTA